MKTGGAQAMKCFHDCPCSVPGLSSFLGEISRDKTHADTCMYEQWLYSSIFGAISLSGTLSFRGVLKYFIMNEIVGFSCTNASSIPSFIEQLRHLISFEFRHLFGGTVTGTLLQVGWRPSLRT